MKTVTSTMLLATLVLGGVSLAQKMPDARLLDMYAVKEGDSFVVHIIADGDISEFLSDRKTDEETYKLTLDVPALSPLDTKYDVETPFSRRFEVWPMQLGKRIYSRVEIELDTDTSSVVGVENESHLFVRIQREGIVVASNYETKISTTPIDEGPRPEPSEAATREGDAGEPADERGPAPPVAVTALGILPVEEPPLTEDSDGVPAGDEGADGETGDPSEGELFYNLFPTPTRERQTLFNVAPIEDSFAQKSVPGIRVGRFALQPSVDVSYIRGSNLLLLNEDPFDDSALMVRGRLSAILLESVNELKLTYEARYRDFETYILEDNFTNVFDVQTNIETSPRSSFAITNHFVQGAFESQEFDPNGEVVANDDPFYRNITEGTFSMELTERIGGELLGSYNRVEFREPETDFFSYDTSSFGGGVFYNLSPLTNFVGQFVRARTRPDITRPEATSDATLVLFGIRGEITPLLRGRIRAGYSNQTFELAAVPQSYSGFVADLRLMREFGEQTALDFSAGRRTSPSAFQENGFYVSNYGTARFVVPVLDRLRFTASGVFFDNGYPLVSPDSGVQREDRSVSAAVGVSFFFTPLTYFSVDYRHDRRNSNQEQFSYRNNAVQFMLGFGFLNR